MTFGQPTRPAEHDHTRTGRRLTQEGVGLQLLTGPVTLVLRFET